MAVNKILNEDISVCGKTTADVARSRNMIAKNKLKLIVFGFVGFCTIATSFADNVSPKSLRLNKIKTLNDAGKLNYFERKRLNRNKQRKGFWKTSLNWDSETSMQEAVIFRFYKNGERTYENSTIDDSVMSYSGCKPLEKFAFILHGWRQSCDTEWVLKLIERLTYHRGGCIVCIDYGRLAEVSYMRLYRNFRIITNVIAEKILYLVKASSNPKNGYIFGFSYGGQLASSIGRALSPFYTFKNIDTCDMAGPGFDLMTIQDHRDSAEHVQCFHSSRDKGTRIYACHQNIRLGYCGFSQPAVATQPYYSSHGLCVQIYINAFDYPFYALRYKPQWCASTNPAENIPAKFIVGYNENPRTDITGEIFVPTSPNYPYNLAEKEMMLLDQVDIPLEY